MGKYLTEKEDYQLDIPIEYYNELDMIGFAQMMKDPSFCYKFYWLEAIVHIISEGKVQTTFDEIIDEMIANAWYSVREYHIHLSGLSLDGRVRDGLERAINLLSMASNLASDASKLEIKNEIANHSDILADAKKQLTNMVPYRALSGFFDEKDVKVNWDSKNVLVRQIRDFNENRQTLPYTIGTSMGLMREVYFSTSWASMIRDNAANILGWIQHEKVKWLQNNNPEVPGLVYKLVPLDAKLRKLKCARQLWSAVIDIVGLKDVYTQRDICEEAFDLDHFIPWSFTMNDELFNLMPMDSSLNSSKNNRLPRWEPFFGAFANNQFLMYEQICQRDSVHKLFEKCYKHNLHAIWATQELYKPGNTRIEFCSILERNMLPLYESARRQGYEVWNLGPRVIEKYDTYDRDEGLIMVADEYK